MARARGGKPAAAAGGDRPRDYGNRLIGGDGGQPDGHGPGRRRASGGLQPGAAAFGLYFYRYRDGGGVWQQDDAAGADFNRRGGGLHSGFVYGLGGHHADSECAVVCGAAF